MLDTLAGVTAGLLLVMIIIHPIASVAGGRLSKSDNSYIKINALPYLFLLTVAADFAYGNVYTVIGVVITFLAMLTIYKKLDLAMTFMLVDATLFAIINQIR